MCQPEQVTGAWASLIRKRSVVQVHVAPPPNRRTGEDQAVLRIRPRTGSLTSAQRYCCHEIAKGAQQPCCCNRPLQWSAAANGVGQANQPQDGPECAQYKAPAGGSRCLPPWLACRHT